MKMRCGYRDNTYALCFCKFIITLINIVSTQEMLLSEIECQPEPVPRELWHYLKFLTWQREAEAWADVLPRASRNKK